MAKLRIDKVVDGNTVWHEHLAEDINDFSEAGTETNSAGWLDRLITPTITVSGGVLSYTLTGNSTYYVNGAKYDVTDFTSGNRSMTKGNRYFFYVDPSNLQQWSTIPWDISALAAPTLLIYYYDDTHYIPVEERHSSRRNPHHHRELHFQIGCYWTSNDGLAISDYTLDNTASANWKWALTSGIIRDEDIASDISAWASGSYNVMYREQTTGYWYWDSGATIPFKVGANSRVTYNNAGTSWVQTEVGVGQCVNYYICAFPSINTSTQIMVVQGQLAYANENSAVNASIANDVAWGTLPSEEIKPLYQVTIQASGTGDKNFIANVKDLRASNQTLSIGTGAIVSSHNSLSGLQGGTAGEYYHLTNAELTKLGGIETGAEVNNISDVDAIDLTDGGSTTLHKHSYTNLDDKPTIPTSANSTEVTTGTDTSKYITPDALAGSTIFGVKTAQITCFDYTTDTATGDGKGYIVIPSALNGMNLVSVHARVITAGTTGTTDIQIANVTDSVDMLSTKLTIDSGETGSETAATPAVIDTTKDDVATNDLLRIDVDAVSTTKAKGLIVTLNFQLS